MVPQNCSVSHILQNIFLCVQQNKDIHTGLELLKGWVNDDRIVIFGWTIPLIQNATVFFFLKLAMKYSLKIHI